MKRPVSLAAVFSLMVAAFLVAAPQPASAAPPTATWSAGAGADGSQIDLTAVALNLTSARLALARSDTGSTRAPRSTATSSNLGAAIGPLPALNVLSNTENAGPTAETNSSSPGLSAQLTSLLGVGAIDTSDTASWPGNSACQPLGSRWRAPAPGPPA